MPPRENVGPLFFQDLGELNKDVSESNKIPRIRYVSASITSFVSGDIAPEPANLFHSVCMLLYFAIGNIVIQALLISICYHIQRVHFIILKMYLYKLHFYVVKKIGEARGTE